MYSTAQAVQQMQKLFHKFFKWKRIACQASRKHNIVCCHFHCPASLVLRLIFRSIIANQIPILIFNLLKCIAIFFCALRCVCKASKYKSSFCWLQFCNFIAIIYQVELVKNICVGRSNWLAECVCYKPSHKKKKPSIKSFWISNVAKLSGLRRAKKTLTTPFKLAFALLLPNDFKRECVKIFI